MGGLFNRKPQYDPANVEIIGGSIDNIDDPVDEHGVGDRGFNDLRYNMAGASGIVSNPSSGEYLITNIRLSASKEMVITYDETPEP